ncbi:MAG TPA: FtsX-like permease family protein [Blastocatellia bacterium]|jgi:putative ABC transport system permease protein
MKAYFKLFNQFILRALVRDRARSIITALGIALGVGVVIAIRLANASSLESFRAATESVAGETSIQIAGSAGRFDELMLRDLGWLRDFGQVSPVITGYAMADFPPGSEYLQVLAVDILRDRELRRYRLLKLSEDDREPTAREFLMLLADPSSIVLTSEFARRHDLSIGDRLFLLIGEGRREFVIRGLLLNEGPARALKGNFALMDISAAQLAFNRLGLLDRLDIRLNSGVNLEAAEREIAARLPAGLEVARPQAGYSQVEKMIAAFHFNLTALGSIALLVGLFLIYNTVSISVITRREEVGTLRAIGVGRRVVLALFLGEALLLATAGTIVGLGLGRLMAELAVRATATTVETFYIASAATEAAASYRLGGTEVVLAFAIALSLALVAAAIPALEAARVRPIEAMRGAERLARAYRPSLKYSIISAALLAAGYTMTRLDAIDGLPVFGFLAALTLMFGGAFLAPNALWLACVAGGRLIGKLIGPLKTEAMLASANLRGAIARVSISVAALGVALAMMVAISVMIGSFRETVEYWVGQTMVADIYARPVIRNSTTDEGQIAAEAIELSAADTDVAAVYPFSTQQVNYQGEPAIVAGGDFKTFLEYGQLLFKSPPGARQQIANAVDRDEVAINETFSLRFKKDAGDIIELPTVEGPRSFKVIAVYYDYSSNRGWAVMDQRAYERHFPYARPSSLSIYLKPGADAEAVNYRLMQSAGNRYEVFFATNGRLREEVMRIFDSTFAITYALEAIAILVAGLGVISTLITLILERRAEIAVLGFLGATRAQVRRMVVIEALLIGGVSQIIGIFTGVMLSLILIYVINVQSFGWTIQFFFPAGFIIQSTLLIIAAAAVAGLYPASRAAGVESISFARAE